MNKMQTEKKTAPMFQWMLLAWLFVIVAAFSVRYMAGLHKLDFVRDEKLMAVPVHDILEQGWSRDTMLDYQEVKGPVFYWSYAFGAEFLGGEIGRLRLITVSFFIFSAVFLLLIAWRCVPATSSVLAVSLFYIISPYNTLLGQLFMSEISFICFAMLLMWIFIWSFSNPQQERRILGPVLYAIVLSILLHHRPHAVAFAGATCLVAFERDRFRSWPWWLACVIAGLSRLPLWAYWGGLVTSDYQNLFGLGLRLENLTYMLAAILPWTAILIWPVLVDTTYKRWRILLLAGGILGFVFGYLVSPDLNAKIQYYNPSLDETSQQPVYMGVINTTLKMVTHSSAVQRVLLAGLAGLGGASFIAFAAVAWQWTIKSAEGVVHRLAFWTFVVGIPLYAVTTGAIYDRYLMVWAVLMPIVWTRSLPRFAQLAQAVMLLAMLGYFAKTYFLGR